MSRSYVEIDFFEMERRNNAASKPSSPERPPSSLRGIQSVVSRINPQLLKSIMAAGHERSSDNDIAAWPTSSNPPSPNRTTSAPPLPVYNQTSRCSSVCPPADMAPLTIFYNGTVTTFAVPRDKALAIIRVVEDGNPAERPEVSLLVDGKEEVGDLPIARRKSLLRFFEKRRERLAWASPYHNKLIASRPC